MISAIDSCDLRIRTLSTTLRKVHQADSPTSTREEGPVFLRHIATLLTRGTSSDKEAGRVIAVTATIENLVKALVTQNSPIARQNAFELFKLDITTVEKNHRLWKKYTIGIVLLSV